jgi:hypothetical protein
MKWKFGNKFHYYKDNSCGCEEDEVITPGHLSLADS